MGNHFFEVVLQASDFRFDDIPVVADRLDDALNDAGMGEVTGGGSGMGVLGVDVDATEFEAGLALLRRVLGEIEVASSTRIHYFGDGDSVLGTYEVYDAPT